MNIMGRKIIGEVDAVKAGKLGHRRQGVVLMNKEQFEGSWQEFKGEIKKKWGQLTDNDLLEAEGDYDKFLGVVQKRYGDKKDEVERWAEDWHERNEILARKATESPNQR
jgi:uncharacterized protein YjbJ (UPF0337 family)